MASAPWNGVLCPELRVYTLGFRLFSTHKSQSKEAEPSRVQPRNVCWTERLSAPREWRIVIQMDFRVLFPSTEGLNCPIAKRAVKCRIFCSGTPRGVTIKWQTKVAGWPVLETPCPGYGKNMEAAKAECHTMLSRFTTAAHLLFTDFMAARPPSWIFF